MRRIVAVLILLAAGVGLAYSADDQKLAIGVNGALYTKKGVSAAQVFSEFGKGQDIFYGAFLELPIDKFAIGGSFNVSFYSEDWGFAVPIRMMDYDANLFVQLHPFGFHEIFDLFAEGGGGAMVKDFSDSAYRDPKNPIMISTYFDLGAGIGINLGPVGVQLKAAYIFPLTPVRSQPYASISYDLPQYALKELRILLGVKIFL